MGPSCTSTCPECPHGVLTEGGPRGTPRNMDRGLGSQDRLKPGVGRADPRAPAQDPPTEAGRRQAAHGHGAEEDKGHTQVVPSHPPHSGLTLNSAQFQVFTFHTDPHRQKPLPAGLGPELAGIANRRLLHSRHQGACGGNK